MNAIDHTFPVSEEIAHKLDDLKDEITHSRPVTEVARRMDGSAQRMNILAVAIGVIALIFWLRD
jgi:hypothetical protein